MNDLLTHALKKQKKRIATKPSVGSKKKRREGKEKNSEKKIGRRKIRSGGMD
jgi:ribosome-associated protein